MSNVIPGGWTAWQFEVTAEASKILQAATEDFVGSEFQVLAFATKALESTTYAYLCATTRIVNPPMNLLTVVHVSTEDSRKIEHIVEINPAPNPVPGGFSSWDFPSSKEAVAVFEAAFDDIIGVDYTPLGNTSQVVAGTNYVFVAKADPVLPNPVPWVALPAIFQDLNGEVKLGEIKQVFPDGVAVLN